ncbi:DUF4376 domain-containing protein [Pseudomonas baetica]|uniref:DUF4376 domain-containing protein n=1 Tax=Pseudomonas baetica TaxID=674054 RepID=UPI001C8BC246|nr:DUF4376 domain-containing protein [Pseudomonas baetica]MBX9406029.1 DUF4376 domain-containing protein [Pseudomonas baetica]
MITLSVWNERGIYTGDVEVDETGALPMRSTPTKPPKLTGTQVARWTGSDWEKLSAAPEPAQAPNWPELIAARRYTAETAGTTVEGLPLDTGRDSQGLITGAAVQAIIDPAYSLHWKTSTGFVELTGQQILGVASMVRAHVQSCFDREAELLGFVADGSITAEMLEEGWPA